MKTILVPTDFSETAMNAAAYALPLAKQLGMDRIVLYNAYQAPVSVDPMVPTVQLLDMDLMKKVVKKAWPILKPNYSNNLMVICP